MLMFVAYKMLITQKIKKPLLYLGLLVFLFLLTVIFISPGLISNRFYSQNKHDKNSLEELAQSKIAKSTTPNILGSNAQVPQIYVSGGDQGYSNGGVIALASTDEPAVVIGGYNISGNAEISLYEANENSLLEYLTHDKDGKQTKKDPDVNQFHYVTSVNQNINTRSYQGSKVSLPFGETGIWYLKVKIGSASSDAFVLRSNVGVLTKEGDNEFIFWGQNFKTKRSISDGIVKILNLQEGLKEIQTVSFDHEGVARANLDANADIGLVQQGDDRAIIPLNLKYLNFGSSYKEFQSKRRLTRYFIFTDRPLYRPGDTIYFKTVLRDDDDARYSIPNGQVLVKIYPGYDEKNSVLEKSYPMSADGTISGSYQLSADAKVGYYTLAVNTDSQKNNANFWDSEYSSNTISVDVEFFRKPEFSIDMRVPKTEFIAGDKTDFKISGTYFSGQPLIDQKVKYTVYSADFYEYQYLTDQRVLSMTPNNDYRYGSWYSNNKVTEGTTALNKNGEAEIALDTKVSFNGGKTQVFSIEATADDGSQNPSFSRKNILVYAGEYGIYRKDASYGAKVNTSFQLPIRLVPYRNNAKVHGINLIAKIHRANWIPYQEPDKKYPSYRKEEEDLDDLTAVTDSHGDANFTYTPTKIGSYSITVSGRDGRANLLAKTFYAYVSADDQPFYSESGINDISVSTDKQKYSPNEIVRLTIFSQTSGRDVFLSLERGRVNRFQIVHLDGKQGFIDVPLVETDIPNIFAKVSSFSNNTLDSDQVSIPISSESKKLIVAISPNSKTFGPGETVNVILSTTDVGGNPVSANVALWAVDKAIFELSDNRLGDIFKTFWKERYDTTQESHSLEGILVLQAGGRGGCFVSGTKVLMSDGKLRRIEDVKSGEYVLTRVNQTDSALVKAKVLKTESTEENGYLIINGDLKVTANHFMWVNNSWKQAGSIQIGDALVDSQDKKVSVSSVEWQRAGVHVYNLEIEKYHTYFAGGVWVHNDKGPSRNTFKDTAYWNPAIRTDASGRAQISFKLPDNLTTWTLAAVASTPDTRVGQGTDEIVATKDVIIRPILPNILWQGDEVILSALVQNFTQSDQTFDVDLKFDSGRFDQTTQQNVQIKSNSSQQIYWKVRPTIENSKSKLVFSARSKTNSELVDEVSQEIPIRAFGFEEKRAETGEGEKIFNIKLAPDSQKEKSKVILSLASNITGTLPTAMKYLIDYPYGCVEQTTSRFVPAVIAKLNSDLFTEALKDKDIDTIIQKGLSRLSTQQQGDGGWTWWFSGKSDPFITTYVVEYLLQARRAGFKVDDDLINRAKNYLSQGKYYDPILKQERDFNREDLVAKIYGLALLGEKNKFKKITDFDGLSPDLLSLAVMANYLNGDTNPQSNGLARLVSLAQNQGDGVFWEAGSKVNFGSKDASTALAIRAILLAGDDKSLATGGVRYLTRTRRFEYWSNTYATAQVVRAMVEFTKFGKELTPNYTYSVSLDGRQIAQGNVSDPKQEIKEIVVPIGNLKSGGSNLAIIKNGEGQVYSTLTVSEFHTDKNARSANHGLSIKREYTNEKGPGYKLTVGDKVTVKITVAGLKATENYGVINDELPSGLVPINESFKNEQYGNNANNFYNSYDVVNREVTENGMVLSLYQIASGERIYTYKARVVNAGTFIVPPANISLMYTPEISGRSEVQVLQITTESRTTGVSTAFDKNALLIAGGIIIVMLVVILFLLGRRDGKAYRQDESEPPTNSDGDV